GSPVLFVQPESAIIRAPSGSWVLTAGLGPNDPPPNLRLDVTTLVARTPAAAWTGCLNWGSSAATRPCACVDVEIGMRFHPTTILTIAGSDPSGGAGV